MEEKKEMEGELIKIEEIEAERRDELASMCSFITGEELQEGIEVTFLSEPFQSGFWESKFTDGQEIKKYTILCIVKDENTAQVKRLDTSKNFLSFLLGAMFLQGIKRITNKTAFIKRTGSKYATKYKIEFKEE